MAVITGNGRARIGDVGRAILVPGTFPGQAARRAPVSIELPCGTLPP
jgi:hypothetical protein